MKNDKKALLEYAEQNGWKYPKVWVIFTFAFIGSLIGAFIFSTLFLIFDKIKHPIDFDPNIIIAPFFIAMFGWLIGFLPALLTGLWVALRQIIVKDKSSYWRLFLIGFVSTTLYVLAWLIWSVVFNKAEYNQPNDFLIVLSLASIGGLSAIICGKLFLPKLPKNF